MATSHHQAAKIVIECYRFPKIVESPLCKKLNAINQLSRSIQNSPQRSRFLGKITLRKDHRHFGIFPMISYDFSTGRIPVFQKSQNKPIR